MLMTMRANVEATRALAYFAAGALDRARHQPEAAAREQSQRLVDLLIPMVKAWSTDLGCETASLAVQVHGGLGFIEDTGAGGAYRDARIAPIYEGTTGIQANDLVGAEADARPGRCRPRLHRRHPRVQRRSCRRQGQDLSALRAGLAEGAAALARSTDWLIETYGKEPSLALAGATPYLRLLASSPEAGSWPWPRSQRYAAEARVRAMPFFSRPSSPRCASTPTTY